MNSAQFSDHLIQTGNTAHLVASKLKEKIPSLKKINPYILRVVGYMHDFGKIGGNFNNKEQVGGDAWHDLEGAYMVLTRNEELGLLKGEDKEEIKKELIEIAKCITSDYCLAEEMGLNFPESSCYEVNEGFLERVNFLRRNLFGEDYENSFQRLVSPDNINRVIVQYADLIKIGGGIKELVERIDEERTRHGKWVEQARKTGNELRIKSSEVRLAVTNNSGFRARLFQTIGIIEELLEI